MPLPKIAIIGAGPAGLTLARLLQKNGIPCTVYEAEKDRHSRDQGGSLDLHPKAGQAALKAAGLFEQFRNHARPESQALKLLKYTGEVLWDENATGNERPEEYDDRPEIDRIKLRDILLDSVDPTSIKWSHKVARVERDPKSKDKHHVLFTNGNRETNIDLLVGADGAWSKVRPLLTDVQPYYSGITGVELWALNVSECNPWLSHHVGAGSCFMFDEGRTVQSQRNGDDSIRTYVCLRQPISWKDDCGIDWSNSDEARQILVDRYVSDCGEDVKRTVLESRDSLVPRQLWMLPVGQTWESKPGVTLIGDSAHLMTPFAGVGVNLAMADALQLARQLVSRKDGFVAKAFSDAHNIEAAVKDYEKEMFKRSKEFGEKTYEGLVNHFSADGGQKMMERIKGHAATRMQRSGQAGKV